MADQLDHAGPSDADEAHDVHDHNPEEDTRSQGCLHQCDYRLDHRRCRDQKYSGVDEGVSLGFQNAKKNFAL